MTKPKNEHPALSLCLTCREIDELIAKYNVPAWKVARTMKVAPSTLSSWKLGISPAPPDLRERLEAALSTLATQAA